MTRLPRGLSSKKVVKTLKRAGFYFKRQKGSHIVLKRDKPYARVIVPDHKSIDTGTLDKILKDADMTVEKFIKLM